MALLSLKSLDTFPGGDFGFDGVS